METHYKDFKLLKHFLITNDIVAFPFSGVTWKLWLLIILLILFIYLFFSVILERTIRIPRSLSVKANSILKGFLNKNPADRLGCNRESGFAEIMTHQFFRNYIDWELVSPFLYLVLLVTELPTLPIWLPFYKV